MASKVLVPATPFTKLQVKKSPPDSNGTGFLIGNTDAAARIAHLEHSVRFLQEQHRLMLGGLHAEIEALRERNRDLQFQLIFSKESTPTKSSPSTDENTEKAEESKLKLEVARLEREAAAARGEARSAEARALQLQALLDTQAERLRELSLNKCSSCRATEAEDASNETRAELRARLGEAERLVRRLRGDAERQRREVLAAAAGGAVTNLLFDSQAASHAHLQCMKNSLHASLRATGMDAYGFQNNYHFPPVHTPEFWREPMRENLHNCGEYSMAGNRSRNPRRPLTLPELTGQQIQRSTVYANPHTRPRANGHEHKNKKAQATSSSETVNIQSPDGEAINSKYSTNDSNLIKSISAYPEIKVVITKMLPHINAPTQGADNGTRCRPRRNHHRKHATDNT